MMGQARAPVRVHAQVLSRPNSEAKQILDTLVKEHPDMGLPHERLTVIAAVQKDCAGIQAQMIGNCAATPRLTRQPSEPC
ncbi:MAG: hypothetical protein ACR2NN_20520 [Bryobacteraceae bacterium]